MLIVGHPYVDVWQAIRPAVLGIEKWPVIPRGVDWKTGILMAFGWPHSTKEDIGLGWQKLLGAVRSYADLEPSLLGRVEEVIDFLTVPEEPAGAPASGPIRIPRRSKYSWNGGCAPGAALAPPQAPTHHRNPKDDTVADDAREQNGNQAGHGQPPYHGVPANALPLTASEDRQWATLAHFGGILGCVPSLLIYLIFKDRGPFTAQNSKEACTSLSPHDCCCACNLLVFVPVVGNIFASSPRSSGLP